MQILQRGECSHFASATFGMIIFYKYYCTGMCGMRRVFHIYKVYVQGAIFNHGCFTLRTAMSKILPP